MNFAIKLTLILITLGIILGLLGSELFWLIIILIPIVILIRTRKKIESTYVILIVFLFIFFGITSINEGLVSIGDIIVLLYLGLFIFVGGILLGLKKYTGPNLSPFAIFGFIFAIIGTIWISNMMPSPLPIAPTISTIPKNNTGSENTKGILSTGVTYPLIKQ